MFSQHGESMSLASSVLRLSQASPDGPTTLGAGLFDTSDNAVTNIK